MSTTTVVKRAAGVIAGGAALAAATYGTYAGLAWLRYGHASPAHDPAEQDSVLDRLMPLYDVVERHHIRVAAPAAATLEAARALDPAGSPIVRAIFKGRELMMGAAPAAQELPHQMADAAAALGWRVLAELPDREVVYGAVTRPWEPNPAFRGLAPRDFLAFAEPGYVKIVWTLRADPDGEDRSIFRTETRAVATDNASRAAFRRYWALVSPGVALIRLGLLAPVKCAAEKKSSVAESPELVSV